MKLKITLASVLFLISQMTHGYSQDITPVPTAPPITAKIQKQIDEIKKIQDDIDEAIKAKKLEQKNRSLDEDSGEVNAEANLYTDSKGVVRAYEWSAGDGDMSISRFFYYDGLGKLRLVLASFGHYSIGTMAERIYLDEKGKILRVYSEEKPGEEDNDAGTPLPKKPTVYKELIAPENLPYTGGPVSFIWNPSKDFKNFGEGSGSK